YYQTLIQLDIPLPAPLVNPLATPIRSGGGAHQAAEGSPMTFEARRLILALCSLLALPSGGLGEDIRSYGGPACIGDGDDYFDREVWENVGAVRCLQCHEPGGDAEESGLILQDPRKLQGRVRDDAMRRNRDA